MKVVSISHLSNPDETKELLIKVCNNVDLKDIKYY